MTMITVVSMYSKFLPYDCFDFTGTKIEDENLTLVDGEPRGGKLAISEEEGHKIVSANKVLIYGRHGNETRLYIKMCQDLGVKPESTIFVLCGCGTGPTDSIKEFVENGFCPSRVTISNKGGSQAQKWMVAEYLRLRELHHKLPDPYRCGW